MKVFPATCGEDAIFNLPEIIDTTIISGILGGSTSTLDILIAGKPDTSTKAISIVADDGSISVVSDVKGRVVLVDNKAAERFTNIIKKENPEANFQIVDMSNSKGLEAARIAELLKPQGQDVGKLNSVKYVNTGITFTQKIGADGLISGQRAKPLIASVNKYLPNVNLNSTDVKPQIYVETDGTNQIVRIELDDFTNSLDYYSAKQGNVGRVYKPVRDGGKLVFQDVTGEAIKGLAQAGKEGAVVEVNKQAFDGLNRGTAVTYAGNNRVDSLSNINDYLSGSKGFEDVVDDHAKAYVDRVNSNQKWQWDEDIVGGENLTESQKSKIKAAAIKSGVIPDIEIRKIDGRSFADFRKAGVVKETVPLPQDLWYVTDDKQFKWLVRQIGGHKPGYTWHHAETPGVMELVPFGIHNVTYHNGGRTPGLWADAPR